MSFTIFYSWQSDKPPKQGRYLIEDALKRAAKRVERERGLAETIVVDRDTKGLPGSPDIPSAILAKIDACDLFVGDMTLLGEVNGRWTPNPNVMFEAGYAVARLSLDRVTVVVNEAHGSVKLLPFDFSTKRVAPYSFDGDPSHRAEVRSQLVDLFAVAIRAALDKPRETMDVQPVHDAASREIELAFRSRSTAPLSARYRLYTLVPTSEVSVPYQELHNLVDRCRVAIGPTTYFPRGWPAFDEVRNEGASALRFDRANPVVPNAVLMRTDGACAHVQRWYEDSNECDVWWSARCMYTALAFASRLSSELGCSYDVRFKWDMSPGRRLANANSPGAFSGPFERTSDATWIHRVPVNGPPSIDMMAEGLDNLLWHFDVREGTTSTLVQTLAESFVE